MVAAGNQVWSTGNSRIDGLIRQYGKQYGVDPFLIYCTMSQESSFTPGATSPKGAMGLMQLMPGTAARYGVTNPYDVGQSIMGGTRYLKELMTMFNGRVDLVLASYNAGEGAVMKYGRNVPPYRETREYVKKIGKRLFTSTSNASLSTWLKSGLIVASSVTVEVMPYFTLAPKSAFDRGDCHSACPTGRDSLRDTVLLGITSSSSGWCSSPNPTCAWFSNTHSPSPIAGHDHDMP